MKIPTYDQQITPSQNFVGPRIVAEESGSGMAKISDGLMNLAGALNDREKRKAEAWFAENSSVVDQSINTMVNDDWKKIQPGAENWTKSVGEKITKLSTDAVANAPLYARDKLKAHLGRTKESTLRQAMQMENAESYRYMGQQFESGVDISAKLVAANPDLLYDNLGKAVSSAETIGTTAEQRASLKEIARAKLAGNAVMGSIDKNPNGNYEEAPGYSLLTIEEQGKAQAYAKQKKQEFSTQKMSSALIYTSKNVVGNMPVLPSGLINMDAAKKEAVTVFKQSGVALNGEQQLQLESYIERMVADREQGIRRNKEVNMAVYFSELEKNGGDAQALQLKYPQIGSMTADDKLRVNNFAGSVTTGGTRITDWPAYNKLITNPDLLKQTNIDAVADKFNKNELNQLQQIREKLLKGMPEQNLLTNSTLTKRLVTEAGYSNDEDQGKIFSLVQSAIDQERDTTGREVPQKRVEELIKDAVYKKVKEDNFLWFDKKMPSSYDLLKDADPEDMAQVDAKLTERGMELTDINRARMLKAMQESE